MHKLSIVIPVYNEIDTLEEILTQVKAVELKFEKEIINSNDHKIQDAVDFWDMTNKQDWYISELSQLGIQSKKYSPAPYSGQESLLAAFDKHYKKIIN